MDKLQSFTRFKKACPYLGRTKTSTLRNLSTSTSPRFPSLSALTERATKCPVMGPALNVRSKEIVAGYASVAGNLDVDRIHKDKGIVPPPGATVEMCPHASAARAAARMAEDLAAAANAKKAKAVHPHSMAATTKEEAAAAAAAGCPFHQKAAADAAKAADVKAAAQPKATEKHTGFDYEKFYVEELDKKHKDKSYRYFNNINRLAQKFPVAHTARVTDEVEVWCANDYLGMGNNPVVLETMQYVSFPFPVTPIPEPPFAAEPLTSMAMVLVVPVTSLATVLCIWPWRRNSPTFTASLLLLSSPPAM